MTGRPVSLYSLSRGDLSLGSVSLRVTQPLLDIPDIYIHLFLLIFRRYRRPSVFETLGVLFMRIKYLLAIYLRLSSTYL